MHGTVKGKCKTISHKKVAAKLMNLISIYGNKGQSLDRRDISIN
jgi:hypothetical protein